MLQKVGFENRGGTFWVGKETKVAPLPKGVYEVNSSIMGFYLTPLFESFEFPYKVYGMETNLIKKAKTYFERTTSGNLGILLNGVKGTGKTVTGKIIANELDLPVLLIGPSLKETGVMDWVNSIPQDVFVFMDEYEKTFGESSEVLSVMDGAANSRFRRVFLLTTNNLYVDRNLIDRPSRIRYLATFDNLSPKIVEELVDDILENKDLKEDCIDFISRLSVITVDMVKCIIGEVNIHNESPKEFEKIFNASKIEANYDVFQILPEGKTKQLFKNVKTYPDTKNFSDSWIERGIEIDHNYYGDVKKIIDYKTIVVKPKKRGSKEIILRFDKAYSYNYNYGYGSTMYDDELVDYSTWL